MALVIPSFTKKAHHTTYAAINPKQPSLSLSGKVILITGGGTGIGARAVQSFAEAGAAHIALLGRRQNRLEETASKLRPSFPNVKFHTYSVDITDKAAVDKTFASYVKAAGGPIDVLVSNAGHGDVGPGIKDIDADTWLSNIRTNIDGSFVVAKAFLTDGIGRLEGGVVINVTSGFSFMMGANVSAYCVSKEAAVRMWQIVGMENPGIRVISIQPGVVESEMNKKSGMPPQDDASLPADVFVWLSSPEAEFLKGKYIFSNWDVDEMKARKEEIKEKKLLEMWLQGYPFME